jgi:hypothetical protein
MDWIHLAQDGVWWQNPVNKLMTLQAPVNRRIS